VLSALGIVKHSWITRQQQLTLTLIIKGVKMATHGVVKVGVSSGMRGFFAVLYDDNGPIESGSGSFGTYGGAYDEAVAWAKAEGLQVDAYRKEAI
jgi:hypothetical protein